MVFDVKDYKGIRVVLTELTWKQKILDPIFGHPEVKPFCYQLGNIVKVPDFVYQSVRDMRSKLFFKKVIQGEFKNYYLCSVVKYVVEKNKPIGYILTVMINRELSKKGKLLWENRPSI
ncbi:TPA: hypothetical protein DIV55_00090 [Patescibacteria group bacterium]|uniref:Uncharacterized protein n=1 Tax=Candidatus Gottesmanbacteria bacterium GW2011_GWA1_43_11 TaxID=1618436 RepID=A0A0G1CJQ3_9BACT|nr:MAG: hypothetical protein UV59_C0003G0045 [Candidatus Gottesmanbacteria bacterium GW2011_GWA1_43_11]HCS78126.1 hypothetical protein [Patescibacteria group bacterium]